MLTVAPIPRDEPEKSARAAPKPAPELGTDEDLLARYLARETLATIAKAYGVSPSTIGRRLKKLGVRK